MTGWLMTVAFFIGVAAFALLYSIYTEVRSIREMMTADRRIANELQTLDD